jgi:hypothetical protein
MLGAIAEFEKTTLVAKLAAARKAQACGDGRKGRGPREHCELRPDVVALAKRRPARNPREES